MKIKQSEEQLRKLKKGKKQTFSLFGGGASQDDADLRDQERIRLQLILDVEKLGKDAENLGVDLKRHEAYKTLHDVVHMQCVSFRLQKHTNLLTIVPSNSSGSFLSH
jgi:conserved oligomeric Golgi complex subunit 2